MPRLPRRFGGNAGWVLACSALAAGEVVAQSLSSVPPFAAAPADASACEAAIGAAEPGSGLPDGLLLAIARAESGRLDPLTRRVAPWPWTINAAGVGAYLETRESAVLRVRASLARGVASVDVGCMQINLRHHPGAFATLEEAFEPRTNVAYAVRFLTELRARHGDWSRAVAHYHSGDPDRGAAYLRRVNAAWGGASVAPDFPSLPARPPDGVAVMSAPVAATVRVVTPTLPAAARVQVITPTAFRSAPPFGMVIRIPRRG